MEYASINAVRLEMWRRRKLRGKPTNIIHLKRPYGSMRKVTDNEILELLKNHTQEQVGDMFGVRQQAVNKRLKRMGLDQFALRREAR